MWLECCAAEVGLDEKQSVYEDMSWVLTDIDGIEFMKSDFIERDQNRLSHMVPALRRSAVGDHFHHSAMKSHDFLWCCDAKDQDRSCHVVPALRRLAPVGGRGTAPEKVPPSPCSEIVILLRRIMKKA